MPTREFRVDDYGAPRYPELVLVTERETLDERPELVEDVLATVAAGTRAALADRDAAVAELATASGADDELVRAQLDRRRAGAAAAGPARPRGARGMGRVRRPLRHPRGGSRRGRRVPAGGAMTRAAGR